ncbi:hypothetical protein DFS34DRAFT_653862 [Phlyctochytrium arcticum]|nr:hypothetical protein DFS34DRAFT_653862 [Phlyctochytrium arcticum]
MLTATTNGPTPQMSARFREPRDMLHMMMDGLSSGQHVTTVRKIDDLLHETDDLRSKQVDETQDMLRGNWIFLLRKFQEAKQVADTPRRDAKQHTEYILGLDQQRNSCVDEISHMEESIESLEAQLSQLQRESQALAEEEHQMDDQPPSLENLKLSIFKMLNMDLQKDADGNFVRSKIACYPKNDIQYVDFEDNKFSRFYYANVMWDVSLGD